jgi:hypothetical protein
VHVFPEHDHPLPDIDTNVSPDGTVSVTVTVPLVGPAPAALDTTTVYTAPVCPCVKLPLCSFVMDSEGGFPLEVTNVFSAELLFSFVSLTELP